MIPSDKIYLIINVFGLFRFGLYKRRCCLDINDYFKREALSDSFKMFRIFIIYMFIKNIHYERLYLH